MRFLMTCLVGALLTGVAVAAPPWPFDMRVTDCANDSSGWRVATTGAIFQANAAKGEITFSQRLTKARKLGVLRFAPQALRGLRLTPRDRAVAMGVTPALRAEVHADSVLSLTTPAALSLEIAGKFSPEVLPDQQGVIMALDEHGGFGAYFIGGVPVHPQVRRTDAGFTIRYDLPAGGRLLLSVCPPREYDWKRAREDRIVHYFPGLIGTEPGWSNDPLPHDDQLRQWRQIANVLVLHLETWDGYMTARPKLRDPQRTAEVLALARQLGFRTLLYCSPVYFAPSYGPLRPPEEDDPFLAGTKLRADAVDMFLDHQKWMLETYDLDGVYWDGAFMDVPRAWECARRTRELLGSKLFYYHATFFPLPWHYVGVSLPFIDTYSDYTLKGETQTRRTVDPIFLRYFISGLNISNAIGTLCYDGCRVDEAMVDWALQANVRLPYWPGTQALGGRTYGLTPEEDKVYREVYLPLLDAVRGPADYAKLAAEGLRNRQARREELARERTANEAALAEYLAGQAGTQVAGNLAALKPATCSHFADRGEGLHQLGFLPAYATDGNPDTYWAADTPPVQSLCVDLGEAETISRVKVVTFYGDKRFYHYRVDVSVDGQTWERVADRLNDELSIAAGDTHDFPARAARYLRVKMISNSANCGVHVAEVEAYR